MSHASNRVVTKMGKIFPIWSVHGTGERGRCWRLVHRVLQVLYRWWDREVYKNMDVGFPAGLVMIVLLILVIYKSCDIMGCRVHKRLKMGNSHSHNKGGQVI
jgi:hypothetical protein